ncbi:hypothetical protein OG729_36985 [Streptomyces sp. NBC_00210]|uniref:hypothetical protein n=1 Tax=unclassified Streptomyces TaxID=2593676 RepID=UPI003247F520
MSNKAKIVELCRRGNRLVGQVAKDFDLTEIVVRLRVARPRWMRRAGAADQQRA